MVGKRQVMDIEVRFLPWLYSATRAANDVLRIGLPNCDTGVKGSLWTLKRQYHEVRTPWLFMSPSYKYSTLSNIYSYKKGVSLLLRDSLPLSSSSPSSEAHICVTDHNASVRERVGDMLFEYTAGSFFQNNNSVLVPLTSYVRDAIFPPSASTPSPDKPKPTHLVDAYCGSGLFAITLSPHFEIIAGIELSTSSIQSANANLALNSLSPSKITFRAGTASDIFATVPDFPRAQTALVVDPPRKGCDEDFIGQLVEFGAGVVVYVSCNVHTQARDVGMILRSSEERAKKAKDGAGQKYVLESVRGFDLFPQTAHVESVAVLRLV